MSENCAFDLEAFRAEEGQVDVPVRIPTGPFRVRPGKDRCFGPVHLSRFDGQWWLVEADVANQFRVPQHWKADLFEGVSADGTYFVLPVTYPRPGCEDWFDTLHEAIRRARKEWVVAESDRNQGCYHVRTETRKSLSPPEWLDCAFAELVEAAFAGRIVRTLKEAEQYFGRRGSRRDLREEFVD